MYSGRTDKQQKGVVYIVNKEIVKSLINVEHIKSNNIYKDRSNTNESINHTSICADN